jgi:hypothetical protein
VASIAVTPDGIVKPAYKKYVQEVTLLDLWEANPPLGFESPVGEEDEDTFLKHVLDDKLGKYAPFFSKQVGDSLDRLHLHQLQAAKEPLNLLTGTGPVKRPIPAACRLVAVAHRYSIAVGGQRPVGFAEIDPDLYKKMNTLNRAGTRLEEAMLSNENILGEDNSAKARDFTAFLLSVYPAPFHGKDPLGNPYVDDAGDSILFNTLMQQRGFSNFLQLYLPKPSQNELPSSTTRQRSYMTAVNNPGKSEEEAFMFVAITRGGRDGIPSAQDLFLGNSSEGKNLKVVCNMVRDAFRGRHAGIGDMLIRVDPGTYTKAIGYCDRIGK